MRSRRKRVRWSIALLAGSFLLMLFSSTWLTPRFGGPESERIGPLLQNSLLLSSAVCGIALSAGTALAFLLWRTDAPCRRIALAAVLSMLFVPLYVQAAGWEGGFGQQGWYSLTSETQTQPLLSGWRAVIWIHTAAAIPWVVLIVGVGLRLVDPELEESALVDGGAFLVATRVTLPMSAGAILAAALWTFVSVAGEMTVTDLFKVRTFAEELYTGFALGDDWQAALVRGLPGIAPISALCAGAMALGCSSPPAAWRTPRRRLVFELGRWRILGATIAIGAALVLVFAPLTNLVVKAGLVAEPIQGEFTRTWSPAHFASIVSTTPFEFGEEFGWTFVLASLAACLATASGAALAWLARGFRLAAWPAIVATSAALAIPGPLVAMMLIGLLNQPDSPLLIYLYDRTLLAPAVAVAVRALPLAVLLCWHGWRTIPTEVLESAAIDGVGAFGRFLFIAVNMRRATLAAAWLATFTVAAGDLAASILVMPPGISTVPTRTFGLLHSGVFDQVAGLCLVNTVISAALTGAAAICLSRRTKYSSRSA